MPLYMFLVAVGSPLSLGDGIAMLSLLCKFLVVCFSVACAEFQVGMQRSFDGNLLRQGFPFIW